MRVRKWESFPSSAPGAVVLEGMTIEPRAIVTGVPARPRGEIQERHEELIRSRAVSYAKRAQVYKSEGLE